MLWKSLTCKYLINILLNFNKGKIFHKITSKYHIIFIWIYINELLKTFKQSLLFFMVFWHKMNEEEEVPFSIVVVVCEWINKYILIIYLFICLDECKIIY